MRSFQAHLQSRAAARIARGEYYKPRLGDGRVAEGEETLAPLIVRQFPSQSGAGSPGNGFGTLVPTARGSLTVDPSIPAVYLCRSPKTIHGRTYEQSLYLWWFQAEDNRHGGQPRAMGVLIVTDREGFPVLWMPVGSTPYARVLYVSRSLEQAAAEQYGPPAPGRAYSVERPPDEAPLTYVARVLEDGPVPMGPYVFIDTTGRCVTGVSCRCMPSQADEFVTEEWYDLRPLAQLAQWGFDWRSLGLAHLSLRASRTDAGRVDVAIDADLATAIRWPG